MIKCELVKFYVKIKQASVICGLFFVFTSCGTGTNEKIDRFDEGTIHISVDESFKPVIDSQIQVYESSYPNAHIIPHYKPEAECLKDFAVDSIRMIIATRGYSKSEEEFLKDSMHVVPSKLVIAYDAIAVIVNKDSPDSLFTMSELKGLLTGSFKKNLIPVFDGLNATSTIRFIIDSVLDGKPLTNKAQAAKSSEELIDYVAKNPNTVGFVGVNWVGNKEDSTQLSFLTKIKLVSIESTDVPGAYVKPVQANIFKRRYPMVRDLVYILKEKQTGLGQGVANFLRGERGQLVFKRAYLIPAQLQFNVRNASLRE